MPIVGALPAILGGAGSLFSGLLGSHAAGKAADTQAAAAQAVAQQAQAAGQKAGDLATTAAGNAEAGINNAANTAIAGVNAGTAGANNTLAGVLSAETANLAPYLSLGTQGVTALSDALKPGGALTNTFSFSPADLPNDPGYQFQLSEGMKALQRSAAAKGNVLSAGTQKGLAQYVNGLTSTNLNDAFSRALNTFNVNRSATMQPLLAALGIGQTATGQANSALTNFGNQAANNTLNAAVYGGNTGLTAAQLTGNLGVNAAQYAGNAGLEAARAAGEDILGGANAQAAGTVGSANSWQNALGGITNAGQMYALQRQFGGLSGGPSASPVIDSTTAIAGGIPLPSVMTTYTIPPSPAPVAPTVNPMQLSNAKTPILAF